MPQTAASMAQLRLGPGFAEADRDMVIEHLRKLERRLSHFPAEGTELEVSVKDRDESTQKVVLEAWLPKFGHMAATSHEQAMGTALHEVRDNLWRQVDDAVTKRQDQR